MPKPHPNDRWDIASLPSESSDDEDASESVIATVKSFANNNQMRVFSVKSTDESIPRFAVTRQTGKEDLILSHKGDEGVESLFSTLNETDLFTRDNGEWDIWTTEEGLQITEALSAFIGKLPDYTIKIDGSLPARSVAQKEEQAKDRVDRIVQKYRDSLASAAPTDDELNAQGGPKNWARVKSILSNIDLSPFGEDRTNDDRFKRWALAVMQDGGAIDHGVYDVLTESSKQVCQVDAKGFVSLSL